MRYETLLGLLLLSISVLKVMTISWDHEEWHNVDGTTRQFFYGGTFLGPFFFQLRRLPHNFSDLTNMYRHKSVLRVLIPSPVRW